METSGRHLGTVMTEVDHTTNTAWSGDYWKTPHITSFETPARMKLKILGLPLPDQVP
jgi:hypothetical protein